MERLNLTWTGFLSQSPRGARYLTVVEGESRTSYFFLEGCNMRLLLDDSAAHRIGDALEKLHLAGIKPDGAGRVGQRAVLLVRDSDIDRAQVILRKHGFLSMPSDKSSREL